MAGECRSNAGGAPVAWQASAGRMPVAKMETENPYSRKWKLKIQPGGVSAVSNNRKISYQDFDSCQNQWFRRPPPPSVSSHFFSEMSKVEKVDFDSKLKIF